VARTLDDYVVTPALAGAFDTALGLGAEAITSGVSRDGPVLREAQRQAQRRDRR